LYGLELVLEGFEVVRKFSGFKSGDIIVCTIEPFNSGKRTIYNVQFFENGENVGSE
jgi:hypothetical protein